LVTVRMAQTEITDMGMSKDASTTSTQEMIALVRRARGFFVWAIWGGSAGATALAGVCSGFESLICSGTPRNNSGQRVLARQA
jgi:hypothetical protein